MGKREVFSCQCGDEQCDGRCTRRRVRRVEAWGCVFEGPDVRALVATFICKPKRKRETPLSKQYRDVRLREVDPAEERVLRAAKKLFASITPTGPSENDRFLADVSRSACAAYSSAVAALSKKRKGTGR